MGRNYGWSGRNGCAPLEQIHEAHRPLIAIPPLFGCAVHTSLRMTWGKAVVPWNKSDEAARCTFLGLNRNA